MEDSTVAMGIIGAEARADIDAAETLIDKFKAAFAIARNHWMVTDEDMQFKAAIGAVLITLDEDSDDYSRVLKEMRSLNTVAAMLSGIPVDFNQIETDYEPIGLIKLWKQRDLRNRPSLSQCWP